MYYISDYEMYHKLHYYVQSCTLKMTFGESEKTTFETYSEHSYILLI